MSDEGESNGSDQEAAGSSGAGPGDVSRLRRARPDRTWPKPAPKPERLRLRSALATWFLRTTGTHPSLPAVEFLVVAGAIAVGALVVARPF